MSSVAAGGGNPNEVQAARHLLRHTGGRSHHSGVQTHSADQQGYEDEEGLTEPARAHVASQGQTRFPSDFGRQAPFLFDSDPHAITNRAPGAHFCMSAELIALRRVDRGHEVERLTGASWTAAHA